LHNHTIQASLSSRHYQILQQESAISADVIAERGVRTVYRGRDLPPEYTWRQKRRAPGILFTVHRPNGQKATIFRPDQPNPDKPGHKYEQECKHLGGSGNVLDVHPRAQHLVDDASVPAMFVEGIKKGDSVLSAAEREGLDILAVSISGVWNFLSEGEPIADLYEVHLDERRAYIGYDSDMLRKPEVMGAALRLAEHLTSRGAEVWVVYLPDQTDGSKMGADDFLAGGNTLEELLDLARLFDATELQRERVNRDEKLRRALDWLKRRGEEMPAKTSRDCSRLSAWRACLSTAEQRGKLSGGGLEFHLSRRTGAELSAMGQKTFVRCMEDLEEMGYVRCIKASRSEEATRYVLLVPGGVILAHNGEEQGNKGKQRNSNTGNTTNSVSHRGGPPIPPLPELRWSTSGKKGKKGLVKGTRRVRQMRTPAGDEPSIRRPGKKRREIVAYLSENGGSATREELLEVFGSEKTQWRDFKKQVLADLLGRRRQYKGNPLSVGPPIIELTEAGVRLVEGWSGALERHREIGGEVDVVNPATGDVIAGADTAQKVAHLHQRAAYRKRKKRQQAPPSSNGTAAGRATVAESRRKREEHLAAQAAGEAVPKAKPVEPAGEKRRRVEQLVYEGMSRRLAEEAVYGTGPEQEPWSSGKPDPEVGVEAPGETNVEKTENTQDASSMEPPRKRRRLTDEEVDEVKRLMAAGMSPKEARAKVLSKDVAMERGE
jgi:hypothetical protein